MPSFECNETQFIENIGRLLDSENRFVVNKRVQIYDDKRYGPTGIPDEVFMQFSSILSRKGQRSSAYARRIFLMIIITKSIFCRTCFILLRR